MTSGELSEARYEKQREWLLTFAQLLCKRELAARRPRPTPISPAPAPAVHNTFTAAKKWQAEQVTSWVKLSIT